MSLQFNNPSTASGTNGIIQLIEKKCGFNRGDISGNTELLQNFTSDVNLVFDDILGMMFPLGGTWQIDDVNFTDLPIITTNLVSGQRDYSFLTDSSSNRILDIYKVMAKKTSSGPLEELLPRDMQSELDTSDFWGSTTAPSGIPTYYDKTGNSIILDTVPNYNATAGLAMLINRESSQFTVSDTTKKPGIAPLHHEYFAIRPAYIYCETNSLVQAKFLEKELIKMQLAIKSYYGSREKDVNNTITPFAEDNR